jgi:hypothetical protein
MFDFLTQFMLSFLYAVFVYLDVKFFTNILLEDLFLFIILDVAVINLTYMIGLRFKSANAALKQTSSIILILFVGFPLGMLYIFVSL